MSSNYPPGVTGNEPQITGIWPAEVVAQGVSEDLRHAREEALAALQDAENALDDQGMSLNKIESEHLDKCVYALEAAFDEIIDDVESRMPEDY